MKSIWRLWILVALVLAVVGCRSGGKGVTDSSVAREVADTFANMANGVTQEANDLMSLFKSGGAENLSSSSLQAKATTTYTVVVGGGINETWKYSDGTYSRTFTDISFEGPNVTGSINPYYVRVKLGDGQQSI